MQTRRKSRKMKRGGNFTLAALGKAAASVLVPASMYYLAKRQQKGRSLRKVMRKRRY